MGPEGIFGAIGSGVKLPKIETSFPFSIGVGDGDEIRTGFFVFSTVTLGGSTDGKAGNRLKSSLFSVSVKGRRSGEVLGCVSGFGAVLSCI